MTIIKAISSDRLEIQDDLTTSCINEIIADKNVEVVQTSRPIKDENWKLINDLLISERPDIQIRIYSLRSADLSFLKFIPNVENLSIDCLLNATGIENLEKLQKLKSLHVGIYSLESFDFLYSLPSSIEGIILGETISKKPSLEGLLNFPNLKNLYIEKHIKKIELVQELHSLEKLTLRCVTPKDIGFLRKLNNLWSLSMIFGGIRDLNALEGLDNIKYLELCWIRKLSDISVVSTLYGLQFLKLSCLRNVESIPDTRKLKKLRRVVLDTMKGLKSLEGLFNSPSLEEFIFISAQNMSPEQLLPLMKLKTLKCVSVGFGSDTKNLDFKDIRKFYGIKDYYHSPFQFN